MLIAGGLALLKAIDDGWTAWDAFQATRTLADPQAPAEEKRAAAANLALTAALEAAEPDDLLPVALPLDDLLRVGIIGGSKGAGKSLPAAYEIAKAGGRHAGVLKNYLREFWIRKLRLGILEASTPSNQGGFHR